MSTGIEAGRLARADPSPRCQTQVETNRFTANAARLLRAAAAAFAFAMAGAAAAAPMAAPLSAGGDVARAELEIQPQVQAPQAPVARANPDRAAKIRLAAPAKTLEAQASVDAGPGAPLQVGFARSVAPLATPEAFAGTLDWQALGDGSRVAALDVTSPGALALRVGLLVDALPAGAMFRFYAPDRQQVFVASAEQVRDTIDRNLASGDASAEARTFWSPVVEGETLSLEVQLPAGVAAGELEIAVPALSHIVASPRDGFALAKAASACELDAMCYQDTWSAESNAVSRIIFTDAGASYVCTGTLLADSDPSTFIPYFLTAYHCVATQTVASTVQNTWFLRSTACNSGVRGPAQTTFGGGTLLYATLATDTAFMRLASQPPAGVAYAGWIAGGPSTGASVTALHHPAGDLQKISFGNLASYWTCTPAKADQFSCNGASASASTFYGIAWRSGMTEGGSSGSGVFADNGRYLIGQLYGGNGTCSAPGTDFYGRFDVAYNAALYQWLGRTASSPAPALDYTDLWWNPGESGWGLSLTQHGSSLFGAWFVYDAGGRATWFVIPGGNWTSGNTFTGDVFAATGPDPTAGFFDPSRVVRTNVGSATLRFSSATQATISYTVRGVTETRAIQRQPFGNGPAVTGSFGDLWWNAAESGWGLSVHQQGQTLFGVWYSYAADGSANWYVMPGGAWTSGDTFTGTLYRTSAGGAFFGATFDAASVARTPAGRLTLRYLDANTLLMTYSLDGAFGTRTLTRQPF